MREHLSTPNVEIKSNPGLGRSYLGKKMFFKIAASPANSNPSLIFRASPQSSLTYPEPIRAAPRERRLDPVRLEREDDAGEADVGAGERGDP